MPTTDENCPYRAAIMADMQSDSDPAPDRTAGLTMRLTGIQAHARFHSTHYRVVDASFGAEVEAD